MARGCSDSDSEEERHDRFKSERKPSSAASFNSNLPRSLDSYSRARSPLRKSSYDYQYLPKNRSRYSEERRYSPKREEKSSLRRDKKLIPKVNEEKARSNSSEQKRSKHRHKKSHDKIRSERYDEKTRVRSSDDESKTSEPTTTIEDHSGSDSVSNEICKDSPDSILQDSKNSNNHNERRLKKHKRSHDECGSHIGKKRKKEKKHRRKLSRKKDENDKKIHSTVKLSKQIFKVNEETDKHNDSYHSTLNDSYLSESETDSKISPDRVPLNGETVDIMVKKDHEEGELSGSGSEQYFGPALPPGKSSKKIYGPQMSSDAASYGSTLSLEHLLLQKTAKDEPGDVIGPLPVGIECAAQSALDARASFLKYHMDNKPDEDAFKKRDSWMVELPEVRGVQLGLGPRKFRSNPAPDMSDRSSWTDTPEEKAKRQMLGEVEESSVIDTKKLEIMERNKEMDKLVKKSEKKSKSLLELHQKELKKKKKKEEKERGIKPKERIPFNRETDLLTNKFDEAQKKSIIKKAQLLNSRFSVGESKYL